MVRMPDQRPGPRRHHGRGNITRAGAHEQTPGRNDRSGDRHALRIVRPGGAGQSEERSQRMSPDGRPHSQRASAGSEWVGSVPKRLNRLELAPIGRADSSAQFAG